MTAEPTAARFAGLCRRLGARGATTATAAELLARYAERSRVYHGLGHLRDCLVQLDAAPREAEDRDAVEAALWFHDAIYDTRAADNEQRSAALARDRLVAAGAPAAKAEEVEQLVLLTRHLEPPHDPSGGLLSDVDLSILGRTGDEFDRYERAIREEYAWVPEPIYRRERTTVLRRLLERRPLYSTDYFRRLYEEPAHRNLGRSLAALEAR